MLLIFNAPFYNLLQIATGTVLHYYVDYLVLFINEAVVVLNDVLVGQFPQNIYFRYYLSFFLFVHLAVVKFLPNEDLAITFAFNFTNSSKTTYILGYLKEISLTFADNFQLLIIFHFIQI